jgi:hypothetical protein
VIGLASVGAFGTLFDFNEAGVDGPRIVGDRALGEQRRMICAGDVQSGACESRAPGLPEPRNVVRSSFSEPAPRISASLRERL